MEKHSTPLVVNFSMNYDWRQVPFEHFKLYTCTQRQIYLFPLSLSLSITWAALSIAPSSSGAPALENHPNLVLHQSTSVLLSSIIDLFVYFYRAAHIAYEAEQRARWRPVGSLNSTRRPVASHREKWMGFSRLDLFMVYGRSGERECSEKVRKISSFFPWISCSCQKTFFSIYVQLLKYILKEKKRNIVYSNCFQSFSTQS